MGSKALEYHWIQSGQQWAGWGGLNKQRMRKRHWVEPQLSGLGRRSLGVPINPDCILCRMAERTPLFWPLWILSLEVPNYCYQVMPDFSQPFQKSGECPGLSERVAIPPLISDSARAAFFTENPSWYARLNSYRKRLQESDFHIPEILELLPIIRVIWKNTFS